MPTYKIGQIVCIGTLPNVVTAVKLNFDPWLQYCVRIEVKSVINGMVTSFADTSMINPYYDLQGVLNGTVKSLYA